MNEQNRSADPEPTKNQTQPNADAIDKECGVIANCATTINAPAVSMPNLIDGRNRSILLCVKNMARDARTNAAVNGEKSHGVSP